MTFGSVRGLANQKLISEFGELWSEGPVIPCGDMHQSFTDALVMVALWNRTNHYIFILWFLLLLSSFVFSSPNLSGRNGCLPYFHTWCGGCGFSVNLECMSEIYCARLAGNQDPKIAFKNCHLGTIAQLQCVHEKTAPLSIMV